MYEKFGEFNSASDMNKQAVRLLAEGDTKSIIKLAEENGIDKEDAQDFIDGIVDELVNPFMAAVGKLKIEEQEIELDGIVKEWKDIILQMCTDDKELCVAIRTKKKHLAECIGKVIAYAFENKVQVSNKIVKSTKVNHNGKLEPFKGPLYLGIPTTVEVKKLVNEYYLK